MKKIIARISNRNTDEIGWVLPVYEFSENHDCIPVEFEERKEKYPNSGTIIIHKEFYNIYEEFERNELFSLEIEPVLRFNLTKANSCSFQSLNGDSITVKKLAFLIKDENALNTGRIKLPYSSYKFAFLDQGENIIGPISIYQLDEPYKIEDQKDFYEYKIQPLNTSLLDLPDDYQNVQLVFKKADIQKYIINNTYAVKTYIPEEYISDLFYLLKEVIPIDIILNEGDEDIINWAEKSFPLGVNDKNEHIFLTQNDSENPVHQRRFERFTKIKEKTSNWVNYVDSYIVNEYINSEEGKDKIQTVIENNKESLLRIYEKELREEANKRIVDLNSDIDNKNKELDFINNEIEELTITKIQLEEETQLIRSKKIELIEFEEKIRHYREEHEILEEYANLKKQKDELLEAIGHFRNEKESLKRERDNLRNENYEDFKKGADQKVKELIPIVRALNGIYPNEDRKVSLLPININKSTIVTSRADFFKEALTYFKKSKRFINEIDIINQLTSIHQNFLTVFTGLPGVGKTSLAQLISKFLASDQFSLTIPVSRGWNSKKSLLGYYNPLKGEYQSDENGLINYFKAFDQNNTLLENVPLLVTLDEANLSPMEHYWSDFIGISDRHEKQIKINDLNGAYTLKLPKGLRFICTINNDHTTENLSPRLIDRACVIKLEFNPSNNYDLNFEEDLFIKEANISYESLSEIFKINQPSLLPAENKIFKLLNDILIDNDPKYGNPIIISPRKIKAIINYCAITRDHYNELENNQFIGLDLAVLQHVLPLINGNGKKFEERLKRLEEECKKNVLLRSSKELISIINKGKDFQTYSYF